MRGASTIQFLHLPEGAKLSSKLVNTIYQDDDGFIYFGTASGLDRFDGYSVRGYVCDPADTTTIHDSYVEYIVAAAQRGTHASGRIFGKLTYFAASE